MHTDQHSAVTRCPPDPCGTPIRTMPEDESDVPKKEPTDRCAKEDESEEVRLGFPIRSIENRRHKAFRHEADERPNDGESRDADDEHHQAAVGLIHG